MSFEMSGPPRGNSCTDLGALAKELDIPPAMLYRWRRELSANQNGSFPGVILSETEQELAAEAALHSKQDCRHFL